MIPSKLRGCRRRAQLFSVGGRRVKASQKKGIELSPEARSQLELGRNKTEGRVQKGI